MTNFSVNNCKEQVVTRLDEIIKSGFKYRKANCEFVRKREACSDIFRIEFHKMEDTVMITTAVFISNPKVISIYNDALGRKLATITPVTGFGIRNAFESKRGVYTVKSDTEFDNICKKIFLDFNEVAIPWFERFQSLDSIDMFMNAKSLDGSCINPASVSWACFALIVANLTKNCDFNQLANTYYNFFTKAQSKALAEPIITVRDFLERC